MSKNFEAILLESKLEKNGNILWEKQYTGIKTWTLSVVPKGSHWLVYFEEVIKRESVNHSVVPDFATPWTVACQASLALGFSRQEYWVAYHSFLQGIFPTQESNLSLLHCRQILYRLSHINASRGNKKEGGEYM